MSVAHKVSIDIPGSIDCSIKRHTCIRVLFIL